MVTGEENIKASKELLCPKPNQYKFGISFKINCKKITNCMLKIEFSKQEKAIITDKIQLYFREELDQDIGQFDAEFLLDFFSEEVGTYYYNRGLYDAQAILQKKMDLIAEAIYEIEKPMQLLR